MSIKNGIFQLLDNISRNCQQRISGSVAGTSGERRIMKQPSKPTRAQKVIISEHKLRPENWMVVYESKDTLEVISKKTSMRKVLNK